MSAAQMNRAGEALHKLRTKAAPKLSENIRRNLRDLGFRQSEFEAKLSALDEPRASGFDAVELLFSPNPGEPLKPLRAIASSGEISRLMLAIKSALAAHDAIPLLVFDEIDTNVGGEIAHAVGAKMLTLGHDHQLICITHLPQVAATASSHFVVTKDVARGRTFSNLREVTGKSRQEEIARMLGGKSESALKLAASLLKEVIRLTPTKQTKYPKILCKDSFVSCLLVGLKENLSLHGTERQHSFTENFVKHLSEAGVNRGEAAEDAFVSGELFEAGARIRVVANREQEEQNRQRNKHDL